METPRMSTGGGTSRVSTGGISRAELRKQQRAERRKRYRPHGAAIVIVLVALFVSALYPARQLVAKRHRITALKAESASLDRQIDELRAKREALQTDAEVERLARQDLNMIRPGEKAYAVVPGPSVVPQRVKQPPLEPAAGPSAFERWWDAFSGAFQIVR
jgi:cell division protein FtsB